MPDGAGRTWEGFRPGPRAASRPTSKSPGRRGFKAISKSSSRRGFKAISKSTRTRGSKPISKSPGTRGSRPDFRLPFRPGSRPSSRPTSRPSSPASIGNIGLRENASLDRLGPAERDLRMLSARASQNFRISKWDMFLANRGLVPYWVMFIMMVSLAIQIIPVIFEELEPDFEEWGRWVWRILASVGVLNMLPMWFALKEWRPAKPRNGKPSRQLPTVDIVVPCFKEDSDSIVDTIVACQRVEYSSSRMHCYVLDDGNSNKLRRSVAALQNSGLLRFPLTYVRRPSNAGRKAGNLNHWLREYERSSSEFFIVLDADMQPFPDMLDILFGHYFGLSIEEQERLSFLQAPQWYQNGYAEKKWRDVFNVSEYFFYRVLQPAMSHNNCAVYVGTMALWKRRAIESIGGFIEGYSTEDSVTGCETNRSKIPGRSVNWISKYVMQPVAAGQTPMTLPALFDQRMRWYYGLCQMFYHHNGYIFASGLTFNQRVLFWVTSASYIANLVNYIVSMSGTLVLLGGIAFYGFTSTLERITLWAFWVGGVAWLANFLTWTFVPGCTFQQSAYAVSTVFIYTPVLVASLLRYHFGIKFHLQRTVLEDDPKRRWHPLFLFPIVSCCIVTGAAVAAAAGLAFSQDRTPWPVIVQVPLWWALWMFLHQHSIAAMLGYKYSFDKFYEDEFRGRKSTANIQRKMQEYRTNINAYLTSVRGQRTGTAGDVEAQEATSYASGPTSDRYSSAASPIATFDTEGISKGQGDETGPIDYRTVNSIADTDLTFSDDGQESIPSTVVTRLSLMLARRAAVDDEMALEDEERLARGEKLRSGSAHSRGGFERNLLARAVNSISLQAYLSLSSQESSGDDTRTLVDPKAAAGLRRDWEGLDDGKNARVKSKDSAKYLSTTDTTDSSHASSSSSANSSLRGGGTVLNPDMEEVWVDSSSGGSVNLAACATSGNPAFARIVQSDQPSEEDGVCTDGADPVRNEKDRRQTMSNPGGVDIRRNEPPDEPFSTVISDDDPVNERVLPAPESQVPFVGQSSPGIQHWSSPICRVSPVDKVAISSNESSPSSRHIQALLSGTRVGDPAEVSHSEASAEAGGTFNSTSRGLVDEGHTPDDNFDLGNYDCTRHEERVSAYPRVSVLIKRSDGERSYFPKEDSGRYLKPTPSVEASGAGILTTPSHPHAFLGADISRDSPFSVIGEDESSGGIQEIRREDDVTPSASQAPGFRVSRGVAILRRKRFPLDQEAKSSEIVHNPPAEVAAPVAQVPLQTDPFGSVHGRQLRNLTSVLALMRGREAVNARAFDDKTVGADALSDRDVMIADRSSDGEVEEVEGECRENENITEISNTSSVGEPPNVHPGTSTLFGPAVPTSSDAAFNLLERYDVGEDKDFVCDDNIVGGTTDQNSESVFLQGPSVSEVVASKSQEERSRSDKVSKDALDLGREVIDVLVPVENANPGSDFEEGADVSGIYAARRRYDDVREDTFGEKSGEEAVGVTPDVKNVICGNDGGERTRASEIRRDTFSRGEASNKALDLGNTELFCATLDVDNSGNGGAVTTKTSDNHCNISESDETIEGAVNVETREAFNDVNVAEEASSDSGDDEFTDARELPVSRNDEISEGVKPHSAEASGAVNDVLVAERASSNSDDDKSTGTREMPASESEETSEEGVKEEAREAVNDVNVAEKASSDSGDDEFTDATEVPASKSDEANEKAIGVESTDVVIDDINVEKATPLEDTANVEGTGPGNAGNEISDERDREGCSSTEISDDTAIKKRKAVGKTVHFEEDSSCEENETGEVLTDQREAEEIRAASIEGGNGMNERSHIEHVTYVEDKVQTVSYEAHDVTVSESSLERASDEKSENVPSFDRQLTVSGRDSVREVHFDKRRGLAYLGGTAAYAMLPPSTVTDPMVDDEDISREEARKTYDSVCTVDLVETVLRDNPVESTRKTQRESHSRSSKGVVAGSVNALAIADAKTKECRVGVSPPISKKQKQRPQPRVVSGPSDSRVRGERVAGHTEAREREPAQPKNVSAIKPKRSLRSTISKNFSSFASISDEDTAEYLVRRRSSNRSAIRWKSLKSFPVTHPKSNAPNHRDSTHGLRLRRADAAAAQQDRAYKYHASQRLTQKEVNERFGFDVGPERQSKSKLKVTDDVSQRESVALPKVAGAGAAASSLSVATGKAMSPATPTAQGTERALAKSARGPLREKMPAMSSNAQKTQQQRAATDPSMSEYPSDSHAEAEDGNAREKSVKPSKKRSADQIGAYTRIPESAVEGQEAPSKRKSDNATKDSRTFGEKKVVLLGCSQDLTSAIVRSDNEMYLGTSPARDACKPTSSPAAARATAAKVAAAKQDGSLEAKLTRSLLRLERHPAAESPQTEQRSVVETETGKSSGGLKPTSLVSHVFGVPLPSWRVGKVHSGTNTSELKASKYSASRPSSEVEPVVMTGSPELHTNSGPSSGRLRERMKIARQKSDLDQPRTMGRRYDSEAVGSQAEAEAAREAAREAAQESIAMKRSISDSKSRKVEE